MLALTWFINSSSKCQLRTSWPRRPASSGPTGRPWLPRSCTVSSVLQFVKNQGCRFLADTFANLRQISYEISTNWSENKYTTFLKDACLNLNNILIKNWKSLKLWKMLQKKSNKIWRFLAKICFLKVLQKFDEIALNMTKKTVQESWNLQNLERYSDNHVDPQKCCKMSTCI